MNTSPYLDFIHRELPEGVRLVAVSKTKPADAVRALYELGQRDFGENYVQELVEKAAQLPGDIRWHFIGHLQRNKVKQIAAFVELIHAVDSLALLEEINKQAARHHRIIDVLLQYHVADEPSKHGMDENEMLALMEHYEARQASFSHVRICGVMGMTTHTDDQEQVKAELARIFALYRTIAQTYFIGKPYYNTCSMGMSGDYPAALAAGSNMLRIGSLLFGTR